MWSCITDTSNLSKAVRVAVVADPQLTDSYSYGQDPSSLALRFITFFSDLYMRRAFRAVQDIYRPDHLIFLGDIMDGGREWTSDDMCAGFTISNPFIH